jgi:hypothetical protein
MAVAAASVLGAWWLGAPLAVAFAALLAVQAVRSAALVRACGQPAT